MGDFRIVVDAVGGHGCQRTVGAEGEVYGCGSMTCPDCLVTEFIQKLRLSGASVKAARIEHWPGEPGAVTDEYMIKELDERPGGFAMKPKRKRHGSFPT
jgi:hypothetical protein